MRKAGKKSKKARRAKGRKTAKRASRKPNGLRKAARAAFHYGGED